MPSVDISALQTQVSYLESASRRNNLLFRGINEQENETWADTEKALKTVLTGMGLNINDIELERVHRIGKFTGNKRPLIARFLTYKHRDLVWANRAKLRGTNVWIEEDYPKSVRENRNNLMPYFLAAKRK